MIGALLLYTATGMEEVNHQRGRGYGIGGMGFFQEKAWGLCGLWAAVRPGLVEVVKHAVVATSAYALYSAYQCYANPADSTDQTPGYDLALHASTTACSILATAVTGLLAMTQCGAKSSTFSPVLNVLGLSFLPSVYTQPTWTNISAPAPPSPRAFHTASVVGTNVFIFGGDSGSGNLNDLWQYGTVGNVWTQLSPGGTLPPGRKHHTASVVGTDVFIFGGQGGGSDFLNDLWKYGAVGNTWTQLLPPGTLPAASHSHTASVVGTDLFIFGGWSGSSHLNDLWKYGTVGNVWTQLAPAGTLPAARRWHTASVVGTDVFIFWGWSGSSNLNDLWKYGTVGNVWTQVVRSPLPVTLTRRAWWGTISSSSGVGLLALLI